jgi:hypothetical protein
MKTYSLSDFDAVPSAKEIVTDKIDLGNLPAVEDVRNLARWTTDAVELFAQPSEYFEQQADGTKQDRSAALMRLAYSGAELGWTDNQIAAVLYDADDRWGKYVNRRDRDKRLIDFVNRARAKHGYSGPVDIDLSKFMKKATEVSPEQAAQPLVYGFNDFIESDFPIDWMLHGLFATGGLGLITAHPGVGKTQFALAMGAHLALGRDNFLKWSNVSGHKKVLFLSLEMSKAPLNLFLRTIAQGYDDLHTLNKNFLVAPFGTPLPLDTPQGQAFLNNLLDEFMPDVVIIDSFQAVISKEMTDELSVKAFFHYLQTVREKYRCGMAVIHHNRKTPNEKGATKAPELSDVYGSTFIAAEVDFVLSLRKPDKENDSLLSVDMLKNRLGPVLQPFDMYRDVNLGFGIEFEDLAKRFATKEGMTLDL